MDTLKVYGLVSTEVTEIHANWALNVGSRHCEKDLQPRTENWLRLHVCDQYDTCIINRLND